MSKQTEQVYELGYHLVSTLDEAAVSTAVDSIKSLVEGAKGEHISEEAPEMMDLAYQITRRVAGNREDFNRAYFGTLKFRFETAAIADLQTALDSDLNIIRYIVFRTVEEETRVPEELLIADSRDGKKPEEKKEEKTDDAVEKTDKSEEESEKED